jgi:hypothetical protein
MPTVHGEALTCRDLSRREGRLEQVAGVRLATLGDRSERGVRVLEFRTGTGFQFERRYDLEIGVLDGTAEADAFAAPVGVLAGSSEPVGSARNG